MAIKSLEQRKHQRVLLFVALGILVIAFLILYFAFWKGGPVIPEEIVLEAEPLLPGAEERTGLVLEERLKKVELDFSFFMETILPFLKSHGDLPVKKGESGRSNPFIPY